jgi:sec-independent protein translocase protein TatA
MSVGPAEILIILVVALLVFGPHRLPEVARQVGSAMRELRKMQDTVRGELDMVLHPEHGTSSSPVAAVEPADHTTVDADVAGTTDDTPAPGVSDTGDVTSVAVESPDDSSPNDAGPNDAGPNVQDATDGGFSGPSDSFI